jgi:hypothetical protein
MLQDLSKFQVRDVTPNVKKYVRMYPVLKLNQMDRQPEVEEYKPICTSLRPFHTIAMNWFVGLPVLPSKSTC